MNACASCHAQRPRRRLQAFWRTYDESVVNRKTVAAKPRRGPRPGQPRPAALPAPLLTKAVQRSRPNWKQAPLKNRQAIAYRAPRRLGAPDAGQQPAAARPRPRRRRPPPAAAAPPRPAPAAPTGFAAVRPATAGTRGKGETRADRPGPDAGRRAAGGPPESRTRTRTRNDVYGPDAFNRQFNADKAERKRREPKP